MLLAIEGFDFYDNAAQMLQRSGFLQWTSLAAAGVGIGAGRIDGAGKSITIQGQGSPLYGSLAANMASGFIGFALNMTAGANAPIFTFSGVESNSGSTQFAIGFNGGDASITGPGGRTTNNLFPLNTWFFCEIGFLIDKTGGRVVVKVNGVVVMSQTSINTSPNTSNLWVNGITFGGRDFSAQNIDDLYICDNVAGPGTYPCNTFLGDRRVYTLVPNGAGDVSAWTPLSGTNYSQVAVNGDDASYNSSQTAGAEDLFQMTDLPSTVTTVIAVQVTGRYRKTDATSHTLTQRIKSGGQDVPGVGFLAPYALSTSYVFYSDLFTVDPATSLSWTVGGVNAVQCGYKLET